jgi:hypothetical protein
VRGVRSALAGVLSRRRVSRGPVYGRALRLITAAVATAWARAYDPRP